MVISLLREVRSLKAFLKPLNLLLFFLVASTGSECGTGFDLFSMTDSPSSCPLSLIVAFPEDLMGRGESN